jgi:hypothetical protein
MDNIEIQKMFFRPICNASERERIFNVKNANDYLLKLRAETIVDHMRLFRVYRNKALQDEANWSLEASFRDEHYKAVLRELPPPARDSCQRVTYGDVFSNNPNGMIFPTDYGPITTISESLQFFLKFSHLALLDFADEVPLHVRFNSLRIAIRVMIKTESLDFLMDPRGILPEKVAEAIHSPIPLQLQFIAGHEFSHFILGHLSDTNLVEQPIFHAISENDGESDYKPIKTFNNSQQDEFEADLQSIVLPNYSEETTCALLEAALLWFGSLELYEYVVNTLSPRNPWAHQSHPAARDRFEHLLANVPTPKRFALRTWQDFSNNLDKLTKMLEEDLSLHAEMYETYGSMYLDEPDTDWRGRRLVDRVDYY